MITTRHLLARQNPTLPDMHQLTIGRMAKLYGLHRSTLYEAVEKGRVSTGFDGKGQRVIALSEMIRVYGEPSGQPLQNPTPSPDTHPTPDIDSQQAMLEELRAMRRELVALREEVAQLRLLPAPKANEPDRMNVEEETPQEAEPEPKGKKMSFADIEKRLAERLGKLS